MSKKQSARVALITGAGAGIGLELTRRLLREGWEVAALIRSKFSEEDDLITKAMNSGQLRIYRADLTDFTQLRKALEQIKQQEQYIDVLYNNAGGTFHELSYSLQGRELHYELQTVVPYIIVMELQPLMEKGTLKTIVNTSSSVLRFVKNFDPVSLPNPTAFKKLLGPYATSKLALSLWTQELAATAKLKDFHLVSVDPGGNNTLRKNTKYGLPLVIRLVMRLFYPPPTKGASLLFNAAAQTSIYQSGSFLLNGQYSELPYKNYGAMIVNMVHQVYEQQFLAANNAEHK